MDFFETSCKLYTECEVKMRIWTPRVKLEKSKLVCLLTSKQKNWFELVIHLVVTKIVIMIVWTLRMKPATYNYYDKTSQQHIKRSFVCHLLPLFVIQVIQEIGHLHYTVHPQLSKLTKSCNFFMKKMGPILQCDLYFNHLYVTCFFFTNSIHASANTRSTGRV